MGQNLYHKVFDRHCVGQLPSGQYQLFIGLHLIHEVTSPQAFAMIREQGLSVPFPERICHSRSHYPHYRLPPAAAVAGSIG